jgi:hypothetical protein
MPSRGVDRRVGEVDSYIGRAVLREHDRVRAAAAADLENALAARIGERRERRDLPLRPIARLTIRGERLALAAAFRRDVRAAPSGIPERVDGA